MTPKILNVEPRDYSFRAYDILGSFAEVHEQACSRKELLQVLGGYDALIVRLNHRVDREMLQAGSCLKVIATATTGLDHIDLNAATETGVLVLSLKGEYEFLQGIHATAEHTWALLLALARRIAWAHASVLNHEWNRDAFKGHELNGQRLGIVGYGRLGEKVAGYGLAFGMQIGVYDPYLEQFPRTVTRCESMHQLLAQSGVVSLHVPLNDETSAMIDEKAFGAMKKGAILVNTSRGALIDETALLRALVNRRLGGAALDVICGEEAGLADADANHLLEYAKTHNNLLITPHLGGATHESMEQTEIFMAKKLKTFFSEIGEFHTQDRL